MSEYRHPVLSEKEFPLDAKIIQNSIKKASALDEDSRDPRDLASILERIMSSIPKVMRHKKRRVSHISSAPWNIVPVDDTNERYVQMANEAKLRLKTFIKNYTKSFVDGDLYGHSVQRLGWQESSYGFVPIIDKNFRPYELEKNNNYNYGVALLKQLEHGEFQRLEIKDSGKHNYLVYVPDFPEPGGLLRTVIYAAFMINLSRQEWSQYIQFLKGIFQAKLGQSAGPDDRKAAIEALKTATKNKAALTTDLVTFTWERLTNQQASEDFGQFLDQCYEEVEIAITNTTMMATDRERNALTVLERNEEDLARDMRFEYELIINNQLLKHDYYMNVDKSQYPSEIPYEFQMTAKMKQDRTANARIIQEFINQGLPITVKEIQDKTGINLAEDPDVIIRPKFTQDLNDALE